MDTLSNILPFKLTVKLKNDKIISSIKFVENIDDLCDEAYKPSIVTEENSDMWISFQSDKNAKLYIDGYEESTNTSDDSGTGDCGIGNTDGFLQIFEYKNYPLPPGIFLIAVSVEDKKYYAAFEVLPKRVDDRTWKVMARELVENIKLMAFDFRFRMLAANRILYKNAEIGALILKMNIIDANFKQILSALEGLCSSAHSKISKDYVLVNKHNVSKQDSKSMKLNMNVKQPNSRYVPVKYTDYNLSENAYIKHIVKTLDKLLDIFSEEINYLEQYFYDRIDNDIFGRANDTDTFRKNNENLHILADYSLKIEKLKAVIRRVKETEWYRSINSTDLSRISVQSMFDPRYGILSKVNKELKANSFTYSLDSNWVMTWKRSDELYEMWGFLKIVDAFKSLGYTLEEGIDVKQFGNELKVSGLKTGDKFVLKKDRVFVNIYYDSILPSEDSKTDRITKPLYVVAGNNKPDCRMDFYYTYDDGNIFYLGTLIVDFKYRTRYNFWDRSINTDTRWQLRNYKSIPKTKYYTYRPEKYSKSKMSPVHEVWAMYPDKYNPTNEHEDGNECIRLYSLVPGHEWNLPKYLDRFIKNSIVEEIEDINLYFK